MDDWHRSSLWSLGESILACDGASCGFESRSCGEKQIMLWLRIFNVCKCCVPRISSRLCVLCGSTWTTASLVHPLSVPRPFHCHPSDRARPPASWNNRTSELFSRCSGPRWHVVAWLPVRSTSGMVWYFPPIERHWRFPVWPRCASGRLTPGRSSGSNSPLASFHKCTCTCRPGSVCWKKKRIRDLMRFNIWYDAIQYIIRCDSI